MSGSYTNKKGHKPRLKPCKPRDVYWQAIDYADIMRKKHGVAAQKTATLFEGEERRRLFNILSDFEIDFIKKDEYQ